MLCAAQPQRGAAELGPSVLRQSSPFFPLRPALLDDAKGKMKTNRGSTAIGVRFRSVRFFSPSCSAEQRRKAGEQSASMSEGRSPELRSRPAFRVAQGSRQRRPRNAGVAFSLATFFWRSKRKYARASGAEYSASDQQRVVVDQTRNTAQTMTCMK